MDQKQIFRQMLDLNKMAFNNAFNAMVMVQDQTEFLANNMLNQSTGIPEEGKKAIRELVSACKMGVTEYKSTVDAAFKQVETMF
jgi:hypothetical protein